MFLLLSEVIDVFCPAGSDQLAEQPNHQTEGQPLCNLVIDVPHVHGQRLPAN